MGVVGKILSPVISLLAKPKAPKPQAQTPAITRNDAAERAYALDEIRKRKGYGANLITGAGGAEARTSGGKTLLGE